MNVVTYDKSGAAECDLPHEEDRIVRREDTERNREKSGEIRV